MFRPLTDDELRKTQARCMRATLGPWVVYEDHPLLGGPVCRMDADPIVCVGPGTDVGPMRRAADDAAFIARARTDLPRLVGEVVRLRAALGALVDVTPQGSSGENLSGPNSLPDKRLWPGEQAPY